MFTSISYTDIISLGVEGEWSKIAPLRILSFDIECSGRKGQFPDAKQDPVITIANMITVQGETKPTAKNVFTLHGCSNIVGSDVFPFRLEKDMLESWKKFVLEVLFYSLHLTYLFLKKTKQSRTQTL